MYSSYLGYRWDTIQQRRVTIGLYTICKVIDHSCPTRLVGSAGGVHKHVTKYKTFAQVHEGYDLEGGHLIQEHSSLLKVLQYIAS